MVPHVKIVPEYALTNPPKRIGFGVLDEHNRLIGVFSNEYFEQLVISYHQVTSSHGNQSCAKIV